jgi:hypothetical protein
MTLIMRLADGNAEILRLTLLLLASLLGSTVESRVHAEPVIQPQPPVLLTQIQPSNAPAGALGTNAGAQALLATNSSARARGSNVVAPSTMESLLRQEIDDLKRRLDNPALDAQSRQSLQVMLATIQARLATLQQTNSAESAAPGALPGGPPGPKRAPLGPPPDPIVAALSANIAQLEHTLADPMLPTNMQSTYRGMLGNYQGKLADYQTNAQLWAKLHASQTAMDSARIAQAKSELATYLAAKLERMQGKKYPAGMSYDAVIKEYRKLGGQSPFDRRIIVVAFLALVALGPPIVLVVSRLRKLRKAKS